MADSTHAHMSTDAVLLTIDVVRMRRTAGAFIAGYNAKKTRLAYQGDLKMFFGWCQITGCDPFTAIDTDMTLYARWLDGRNLAPSTICRRIGTVRGWYGWLIDHDHYNQPNPMRRIKTPTPTPIRQGTALTNVQVKQLLTAAAEHSTRLNAVVCLGLWNGLRIGEICGANIEGRGRERYHETLSVRRKGGETQIVPLQGPVIEALSAHMEERDYPESGPLVVNTCGRRIRAQNVRSMLATVCASIDIPHVAPHDLRRTAISLLFAAGENPRDIQLFANHKKLDTTQRYDVRRRSMDEHLGQRMARLVA